MLLLHSVFKREFFTKFSHWIDEMMNFEDICENEFKDCLVRHCYQLFCKESTRDPGQYYIDYKKWILNRITFLKFLFELYKYTVFGEYRVVRR